METIRNMILYIIYDLLGLSGIALLIIISITSARSYREDKEIKLRQEERDKEYHKRRMKELEAHRD
jgi:hypothetical protein